ncbi:unnamed protein product, partial [Polarella glacialis]
MNAAGGVWIFDDATQPQSRGKELSTDMAHSRGGFTLVQVGDLGLLLSGSGPGEVAAVRRFATRDAAKSYVGSFATSKPAVAAAADSLKPGSLPCPAQADLHSCKAWCQGVWSGPVEEVRATLGGKSCSELTANDPPHERPTCMCYDQDYTSQLAMCLSSCKPP